MCLFNDLDLALPTTIGKSEKKQGLSILVWSGASSVGTMAIQLASLAGFTVFATASETHHEYLKTLGATQVFDYKSPTVVSDLVTAAINAGNPITYAIDTFSDAVSLTQTIAVVSKYGGKGSKVAHLLPWPESETKPDGISTSYVQGEYLPDKKKITTWLFQTFLTAALESGSLVPSPKGQVVDGGVNGLQTAMDLLKDGVSATKLVVKLD
jgi:threonine dehydrogenase-like Zn-dependent dehydrogenase